MRPGFLLLGAGAVLDVAYHALAATAGSASHSGGLATAIHVVVLAGMVVTFAGVIRVGFRPQGAAERKEIR